MTSILITGGTGRIGKRLIKDLSLQGHHLNVTTRSKQKGVKAFKEEDIPLDNVTFIEVDFQTSDWQDSLSAQLPDNINVLIHAARNLNNLKVRKEGKVSPSQMQSEMHLAVTVPYELIYLILEKGASLRDVIFLSSMYGVVGPNPSLYENLKQQSPIHYGVSKAAQIHLTKELAIRLAEKHIRVNCISYGGVEGRVNEEFLERYKALNPMRKMLSENDLSPPVQFIIDHPELSMTGENIKVDGGWTIW